MKTSLKISNFLNKALRRYLQASRNRHGQTLVEYALIISLLVVVTVTIMIQTGTSLKGLYCTIESQVSRTGTGS